MHACINEELCHVKSYSIFNIVRILQMHQKLRAVRLENYTSIVYCGQWELYEYSIEIIWKMVRNSISKVLHTSTVWKFSRKSVWKFSRKPRKVGNVSNFLVFTRYIDCLGQVTSSRQVLTNVIPLVSGANELRTLYTTRGHSNRKVWPCECHDSLNPI